jgi:hypothetical protein
MKYLVKERLQHFCLHLKCIIHKLFHGKELDLSFHLHGMLRTFAVDFKDE